MPFDLCGHFEGTYWTRSSGKILDDIMIINHIGVLDGNIEKFSPSTTVVDQRALQHPRGSNEFSANSGDYERQGHNWGLTSPAF